MLYNGQDGFKIDIVFLAIKIRNTELRKEKKDLGRSEKGKDSGDIMYTRSRINKKESRPKKKKPSSHS